MMLSLKRALLALIVFLSLSPSAHADESWGVPALYCNTEQNLFLLNFAKLWNEDDLSDVKPQETQHSLLKSTPLTLSKTGTCVLKNKGLVSASVSKGQAFGYGMGGGDPDLFITLTMAGRTLYYKAKYYAGYGVEQDRIKAILYDGSMLQECSSDTDCQDASERLIGEAYISADELETLSRDRQREAINSTLPFACKKYNRLELERTIYTASKDPISTPNGSLEKLFIDINNDGKEDLVYKISSETHYFYGSYLVAFLDGEEKAQTFFDDVTKADLNIDSDHEPAFRHRYGATFISLGHAGSDVRYVFNEPKVDQNQVFIYSFEHSTKQTPSGALSQMMPDKTIKTLCLFP